MPIVTPCTGLTGVTDFFTVDHVPSMVRVEILEAIELKAADRNGEYLTTLFIKSSVAYTMCKGIHKLTIGLEMSPLLIFNIILCLNISNYLKCVFYFK